MLVTTAAVLFLLLGTIQPGYGQAGQRPRRQGRRNRLALGAGQFGLRDARCNAGWHFRNLMGFSDNVCLWFSPEKATFTEAMVWCDRIDGAHLVELPNYLSNTIALQSVPPTLAGKKFWIGLSDMENEGVFMWVNKKRMAMFPNFAPGKGLSNEAKNCVFMDATGQYHDDSCGAKYHFICEK